MAAPAHLHGCLRDECLNEEVFETLGHERRVLARWRYDYNHIRPHSALGGVTPVEARRALAAPKAIIYETARLSF